MKISIKKRLKDIRLVATDCDGVLTDGGLYYTESGEEMKRFQVLDGVGFLQLKEHGIKTAIITGEKSAIIDHRAKRLKVDYLRKGTMDKLSAIQEICREEGISLAEVAYIGDDWFDMSAVDAVGLGCVPGSAMLKMRRHADYVTRKGGGKGCFREVADMILKARGGKK